MLNDPRLKPQTAELVTDRANDVMFSVVSLWEVAIKVRATGMTMSVDALHAKCIVMGMVMLDIKLVHLETLSRLVDTLHKDPFDLLLISQAMTEDVPFLTADRVVQRYPIAILKA